MRKIFFEIKQAVITAFRLFYVFIDGGRECPVCSSLVFIGSVCRNCRERYFSVKKTLEAPRCNYCGKILISSKETCTRCREERVLKSTDRVIPLFSYRLWNKELMFRWKMQDERMFSPFFAKLLAEALHSFGEVSIVPIPPRKGKIREKGWDQIEELCEFLEKRYNYKVLRLLERISHTQQKKLSRSERLETIKSAYRVKNTWKGLFPEEVCLIDDVCTTGSTLESCAEILKKAGVKKVHAMTLFTVD